MRLFARSFLFIAAISAVQVFAAGRQTTTPAPSYSYSSSSSGNEGKHVISPVLGFMGPGSNEITDSINGTDKSTSMTLSGAFGIGCDYEYMLKDDFSVGGFFRYYTTNDTVGTIDDTETAFLLSGIAHAYVFNTTHFSGYLGSGLTLIKVTEKLTPQGGVGQTWSPSMTLGFPFQIGVGYKLNDMLTLGVEHMQVMALGDKVNGWPVNDFMFRLSIAFK